MEAWIGWRSGMGEGSRAWAWIQTVEGRKQSKKSESRRKKTESVAWDDYNGR